MDVDLEELAAVIEQLDKTEFDDLLYEKGDLRIHIRRGPRTEAADAPSAPFAVPISIPATTSKPAVAAPTANPVTPVPAASSPAPGPDLALSPDTLPDGHTLVRSPMLGTFYRSPKPGEAPFAETGATVAADSVLCIIEVMKLMNSVFAGVDGQVVETYVRDGELVEFDQPLFVIKQAA